MTSQLRMYTINRGMMDEWVKLFTETLVPMQEKHGIKIEGMWVSEDGTQFIWIRSFTNSEDVKVKEAAFYGSPEWNASMDHARSHLARTVVQTMEPVLHVTGDSLLNCSVTSRCPLRPNRWNSSPTVLKPARV